MAGLPTTAGSRVIAEQASPAVADAACLAGLRAAGNPIVGRTNLHELALGVTGINPWFGTPVNPLDPALAPGGSSSGSAVAVAAGDADIGYGTDTGGSIRIPAACCGIAGLKTTWGRIPVSGVRPLAPSLDTIGPLAARVSGLVDGMRLLEPGFCAAAAPAACRIGRIRVPAAPAVDAAVDAALAATGWPVTELDPVSWQAATRATVVVVVAEAYQANREIFETAAGRLAADVAARLDSGRRVTAAELATAMAARRRWQDQLRQLFGRFDLLVTPTLAIFPPRLEQADQLLTLRCTLPVNMAGVPALALPVPAGGAVPASIQLIGPAGSEEELLAAGSVVEAACG
jgi:amidase